MMGFKDVFTLFCACWKLYKEYATVNMTDAQWDSFVEQAMKMYHEQFKTVEFAKEMITAVINEIERINKGV